MVAENAKIYYTENSNATADVENTENGWTEIATQNAKLYLKYLKKSIHFNINLLISNIRFKLNLKSHLS